MFYIKWGKKKIDFLRTDLFILKKCIEKTEQCDIINQVSDISVETFRMCWFWNTVMCRLQVFLICWSHYWPCQLSKRRQGMGLKNCITIFMVCDSWPCITYHQFKIHSLLNIDKLAFLTRPGIYGRSFNLPLSGYVWKYQKNCKHWFLYRSLSCEQKLYISSNIFNDISNQFPASRISCFGNSFKNIGIFFFSFWINFRHFNHLIVKNQSYLWDWNFHYIFRLETKRTVFQV